MRSKKLLFLAVFLSLSGWLNAADDSNLVERFLYSDLGKVRNFYQIRLQLPDDAPEKGVSYDRLLDAAKLAFRNAFNRPMAEIPTHREGTLKGTIDVAKIENIKEWAAMRIQVRWVGDDYPVAYYLRLSFLPVPGVGERRFIQLFETDRLGYASWKKVTDDELLTKTIEALMKEAAIVYFKVRGEI